MALNTNRTDVDFSFRHVEQVDKLGQSVGGVVATVQGLLDSRAEDNLTDVNNVKTTMRSTTVGDSGAKNIGASIYADVVGVTVQAQLEEINLKSATAFPVLDGSLGDVKLSNTAGQIKDVVVGHTAQLAEKANSEQTLTAIGKMRSIAHRGFWGLPQNTLPAFKMASDIGYWGIETDTQLTSDDVWIINHDQTVDAMTNGTGNVSDLTLAEIKALTVDAGTNVAQYPNLKIPTLEEYFLLCKKYNIVPVVEIKSYSSFTSANYDSYIALIQKMGLEYKSITSCKQRPILDAIRQRSKKIYLFYIVDTINQTEIDYCKSLTNTSIYCDASLLTQADVELAHSNGLLVSAYFVYEEDIQILLDYGVDFIVTDRGLWRG